MVGVTSTTVVHQGSKHIWYEPGQEVAPEHVHLIGDHLLDGPRPENGPSEVRTGENDENPSPNTPDGGQDPQSGADEVERPDGRSGLQKWTAYATSKGLTVREDATKEQVIAQVEAYEEVEAKKAAAAANGSGDGNGSGA